MSRWILALDRYAPYVVIGGSLLLLLGLAVLAWAQSPAPSCEVQVQDQYRQLVTDQVLAAAPAGQTVELSQQLGAMIAQLRIVTTKYYRKVQQGLELDEQVAGRDEQIRQLRQQVQTLNAEIQDLKHPK
jgi:hypothetical protein